MRFIRFIASLVKYRTRGKKIQHALQVLKEQKVPYNLQVGLRGLRPEQLQVLKEQKVPYNPHYVDIPSVTREYRAACQVFLHTTDSALRDNVEDWEIAGDPHSSRVLVKEQSLEEAAALFNYGSVDHHAIALSLAQ